MQERAKRLAFAVVLTAADVATFHSYSGVIWRTWGQYQWAKAALLALLGLWIASAAVIWGHVSNEVRQTLRERDRTFSRNPALAPRDPRRDSDV
jgi:uncharacterized membrane protein YqjE